MSSSPNMSGRPLNKIPSSDNVCAKYKDDRGRNTNNNATKHFNKQKDSSLNKSQKYARPRNNQQFSGGRRNQLTEQRRDEFSSFSLDHQKGKKINLNHLLNFSYDATVETRANPGYTQKGNTKRNATVFNKEQFMQANCQMEVSGGNDYSVYQENVDLPMEWDFIEKVNMWSAEPPSCPICLYPPSVPKITKCGHIYCWPCILHYLALGDDKKQWKKCPICHEAVQQKDLKSVTVYEETNHDTESVITMRLLQRNRGSNICVPVCDEMNGTHFEESRNKKFLVSKSSEVLENIVKVEREKLEFLLATENDELEKTFLQLALDLNETHQLELDEKIENEGKGMENKTSEDCGQNMEDNLESDQPTTSEHVYYFYQANDGQHIYVHPLNVKCLVHQFGSFDRCPSTVTAKIIESERITLNEATRKRYRYLSHLPLSLEIRMVELDLRPPIVSAATLATFRDALERRQLQRRKKAREEKRVLRRAFNEGLRKQGKFPSAHLSLNNQKQFPQIQQTSATFSVLLSNPSSEPPMMSHKPPVTSQSNVSAGSSSVGSLETDCAGPSFAEMLRTSHDQPTWPRLSNRVVTSSMTSQLVANDDDPEYVAPPTYKSSFGDALSNALDRLEVTSPVNQVTSSVGERPRKRKGKKGKKVLLFSTAGQARQ